MGNVPPPQPSSPINSALPAPDIALQAVPARHSTWFKLFAAFFALTVASIVATTALLYATYLASVEPHVPAATRAALVQQVSSLAIGLALFALVLSFTVAFALAHYFGKPVRQLGQAIRRVARGEVDVMVRARRRDEYGQLVSLFNGMVGKMREVQERNAVISQLKSQFITVAAHQLRTPLSGVQWAIKSLLEGDAGPLQPKQRQLLEECVATNGRLIKLIRDLFDVTRIEAGQFGYDFREVDLRELLRTLVREFLPRTQRQNLVLRLVVNAPDATRIFADANRLHLALSYLLDNAIRYSPRPSSQIVIRAQRAGEWLKVSIQDFGIGIPAAEHDKIFSRFYRATNAIKIETEGSGLGLYIVKSIIVRHGGKIWLTSNEGKGTTVTLTLPIRRELIPPKEKTLEDFIGAI